MMYSLADSVNTPSRLKKVLTASRFCYPGRLVKQEQFEDIRSHVLCKSARTGNWEAGNVYGQANLKDCLHQKASTDMVWS